MTAAIEIEDVAIRFGGVQAVDGVGFAVAEGDFVGLIGPNGAGKTTLMRIIAGVLRPDRGRIALGGEDVTAMPTASRVRKGLALTHQVARPFRDTTVLDNVVLAAGLRHTATPLRALLHVNRRAESEHAAEIIARVGLAGTERQLAGALPLGQMKRLEVARALATGPRVMLLDEPLAGLNHAEAEKQIETIAAVNDEGVTIVLVEHNLKEVLRASRRLVVLDNGRLIADGEPQAVMENPAVREAYIGKEAARHAEG